MRKKEKCFKSHREYLVPIGFNYSSLPVPPHQCKFVWITASTQPNKCSVIFTTSALLCEPQWSFPHYAQWYLIATKFTIKDTMLEHNCVPRNQDLVLFLLRLPMIWLTLGPILWTFWYMIPLAVVEPNLTRFEIWDLSFINIQWILLFCYACPSTVCFYGLCLWRYRCAACCICITHNASARKSGVEELLQ